MVQIELFTVVLIFTIIQASTLEERRSRHSWLEGHANDWEEEVLPWHDIHDSFQHSNDITKKSHTWQYSAESDDFPTNSRIVKISNMKRGGFLAVNKSGKVYATANYNSEVEFKKLVYSFQRKKYRVKLQNVKYSKYIAISCRTGHVYSTANASNVETALIYSPDANNGDTFQSETCSQGAATFWYLGIRKDGRNIKNARIASASDKGTRFVLF